MQIEGGFVVILSCFLLYLKYHSGKNKDQKKGGGGWRRGNRTRDEIVCMCMLECMCVYTRICVCNVCQ